MIKGTIYLVDEPNIQILKNMLSNMYPPNTGPVHQSCICIDLDESDNMLETWFPNHCQKATLLCPPPIVMYKEIDGDAEGFSKSYYDYLEHDITVQEFIASILYFLHIGGNIIIYTPSYISDEALWLNILQTFFFTQYGIKIGTSGNNNCNYDFRYNHVISDILYCYDYISIFEFIQTCSDISNEYIANKACMDLMKYCGEGDNPMHMFEQMKLYRNSGRLLQPGLEFGGNNIC